MRRPGLGGYCPLLLLLLLPAATSASGPSPSPSPIEEAVVPSHQAG